MFSVRDILSIENERGFDPCQEPDWTKTISKSRFRKTQEYESTVQLNNIYDIPNTLPSQVNMLSNISDPQYKNNIPSTFPYYKNQGENNTTKNENVVNKIKSAPIDLSHLVIPEINHPFIGSRKNPPNKGNIVNNISQLIPKQVDLMKNIRKTGLVGTVNMVINTDSQFNIKLGASITDHIEKINKRNKITQEMSLMEVIVKNTPLSWEKVFNDSVSEFKCIQKHIESHESGGTQIIPLRKDIFTAFHLTPLPSVRVVIVGQDPYHSLDGSVPIAHGLSFSVRRGSTIPPSLNNIFKEIKREIPNFNMPSHGDLTKWAQQGVLMLNNSLTVNPHQAGSHGAIWKGFITRVLMAIEQANPRCIFVLWGKKAQTIKNMISSKSVILESSHPRPISAKRGFNNCGHFLEINKQLLEMKQRPINWNLD